MSIEIVLQQMIIIFILIGIGMVLYKKDMFSENTSKQVSGVIVNITNPALLICSALDDGPKVPLTELGISLGAYTIVYGILIAAAFLIPYFLRVPRPQHYSYQMLTIFGNVGFIGIPLASAVLGTESLIFVSIYNLIFNILIYTFGISVLEKASRQQALSTPTESEDVLLISDADACTPTAGWKKLINMGTVSSLATIILYLAPIHVPVIVSSTADYIGRATTLLSMLVLGVSVAQLTPKDIFTHPKLYGFTILRQVLLPVGFILLMRPFITNTLIFNTMVLMLAVPAANMPLLLSKQLNLDTSTLSQAIILTTILSLVTIPIVCLFL